MPFEEVTIGPCRLIRADCMDVLPTLGIVDAVVTDPPYGIQHKSGGGTNGKWHFVRHQGVTIANDHKPFDPTPWLSFSQCILWGANFYSDKLPGGGWLIWDKRPGIKDMVFNRSDSELAYFSGSKTVKTFRHLWHGLCRATEIGEHLHPTQKPVALMQWCVEMTTGSVLDPYMGCGPTALACINLDRPFTGIEIDPKYFDLSCRRIEEAWGKGSLFDDASKPDAELFAGVA